MPLLMFVLGLLWFMLRPLVWSPLSFLEKVTKFTAAVGNNIEEGIREAKEAIATTLAYAKFITPVGGTAGVTGYIGPLISTAVSREGLEEASFLEAVEQSFDGCTPEVALKPETTAATMSGGKWTGVIDISNFLGIWKKIGTKKRWRGHTLLWWQGLPSWMYLPAEEINGVKGTWSGTEAEYRAQILSYIKKVVEAVGTRVDCWDVLNELTNSGALRACAYTEICGKSLTIVKTNPVMQFYAECIRVAKEANPAASMFANEYEIESAFNYSGETQRGEVFLKLINVLQELEVSNPALYRAPDGVGMQFHTTTKRKVTVAEIQAIVPKYTEKELEVEFTEFDCQIEPGDTEETQGQIYSEMVEGAKKSGVGRVTIWGVTDKRTWLKTQWEVVYGLTSNTAEGVSVLNLTEAETKKIKRVSTSKQVQVRFSAVTAGCGFSTATTYFVVGSTANSFELAATEGGAAIKVTAGKTLVAAETKVFKWGGETSMYPRPAPFNWNGEAKGAWRSIERSRPEQPGIGAWVPISSMSPNKVGQKASAGTAQARTEGLNVRLSGVLEATAGVPNSTTIFTLPVGLRPSEKREIDVVVKNAPQRLGIATNGAVTYETSAEAVAADAIRLDNKTFAL